ncbi:MAG: FlaA1/EpsC-like NDP-sugar epimerase, partial [Flavobacteriaceae bacterium]
MLKKILLKALHKSASRWLVLVIDVFLVCFSFIIAYAVRFNVSLNFDFSVLALQLPIVSIVSLFSFLFVGSYKGIIRHTGTRDVFNVFLGVTIYSLLIGTLVLLNQIFMVYPDFTIPRSIILIHYLVTIFVLILSRYVFKAFYDVISTEMKKITNVLIFGAGEAGIITYGVLNRDKKINFDILGFIDDAPSKINKKIDQIKIYAFSKIDKEFIERHHISEVI